MQLHTRGLEMVYELSTAADHLQSMKEEDVIALLREASAVLAELLKRDVPKERQS
ncbi:MULTISPECIES: hypothetical protein [unclassified Mesorhizobium]|uniref:hypothetical protein n=1 Tax=unclassified Mesorhizobium TaxID=325217 RepID=UPI0015E313E1|nr:MULTISPECIES: hypothetical protein [unclassified Mesorhizobium]